MASSSHWGKPSSWASGSGESQTKTTKTNTVVLGGLWLSKKNIIYIYIHLTIANFGEKTILQLLNCEFQILQSICGFWFASPLLFINLTCWGWPFTCWGWPFTCWGWPFTCWGWPIHRRPLGCHDTMGLGKPNKLPGQTVRDVAMAEN